MENQSPQINFWFQTRTIIAITLALLSLAEIVDLTIVSVALPNIMGSLSANINEISLTITSYIVAAAVLIPLTGFVVNKYGIKKVALTSSLIFAISSILCGISTTVTQMIFFRLLQGVGGAFMPSLVQAYVANNFDGNEQNKMISIVSSTIVLGPILGPVIGGIITEYLNWRWIFFVNVPICAIAYLVLSLLMEESKVKEIKVDFTSFIFMVLGVSFLEYFIDEGNSHNWFDTLNMVIIFALAIIFIVFFIWRGLLGKSVVNFKVFKYKETVAMFFSVFLFMLVLNGILVFFPTLLQQGYGYSPDVAGFISAPRGICAFLSAPLVLYLNKKFDPRAVLFLGISIMILSIWMLTKLSVVPNLYLIEFICIIQGFGLISIFINISQVTYSNKFTDISHDISGIFNFFRNIGSSIGTAIAATILSRQQQVSWHDLASKANIYSPNLQNLMKHFPTQNLSVKYIYSVFLKQSFFIANLDVFYYCLILSFGLLLIPFIIGSVKSSNQFKIME